jgi:sortase A
MKKKRKIWRWVILGIPIFIVLLGIGIISYFGFEQTKQTVLLSYTIAKPHKPDLPDRKFKQLWSTLPYPGENIGDLKFASVGLDVPVVQGTGADQLKQGAGHYAGSVLPGQGGNVVISGHRDTVFRKLKNIQKGDQVTFTTKYGDFVYEITDFKIVHADDQTVIVPTDYETLTLTTCYPFNYIGDAPDRFIVYTKLVTQPQLAQK